ncbi:putative porin [Luteolibacter ambystomatis]|uniref:Porin n=1 Tax=Luteolibacter ambystomatis TaxID=2824561 RepID=A0A975J0G7_9BACT|nr:putative porin [Luteolibacter ambystomatis]
MTGRLDYDGYEPVRLSLTGEFVKNVAFDKSSVAQFAVNNRGPSGDPQKQGLFEGGDTAWMVNLVVGTRRWRSSATGRPTSATATSRATRWSTA